MARSLTPSSWRSDRATAEVLGLGDDDRWLSPLPPSHVAGLMILMRSVIAATTAVIARFEAGATAEASPAASAPQTRGD